MSKTLFSHKLSQVPVNKYDEYVVDRTRDVRIIFKRYDKELVDEILEKCCVKKQVLGIVRFTSSIDITFEDRDHVIKFHDKLCDIRDIFPDIVAVYLHRTEDIDVNVYNVPITLPNSVIASYFKDYHGDVNGMKWIKDSSGYPSGHRVVSMKRDHLEQRPIKSFIYIGKVELFIKHRGQSFTCRLCKAEGHTQKTCALNNKNKSNNEKQTDGIP